MDRQRNYRQLNEEEETINCARGNMYIHSITNAVYLIKKRRNKLENYKISHLELFLSVVKPKIIVIHALLI